MLSPNEENDHADMSPEKELMALSNAFSKNGTASKKWRDEFAFLALRMIFSSGMSQNTSNQTVFFLNTFRKFQFNDALDGILDDISELTFSEKKSSNIANKWKHVVEKLEQYLEGESESLEE